MAMLSSVRAAKSADQDFPVSRNPSFYILNPDDKADRLSSDSDSDMEVEANGDLPRPVWSGDPAVSRK
jgi:hypothetical protein